MFKIGDLEVLDFDSDDEVSIGINVYHGYSGVFLTKTQTESLRDYLTDILNKHKEENE